MTRLVVSIFAESLDQVRRDVDRAFAAGAEGVELRIDAFPADPAALPALIRTRPDRTWILTCRSRAEGGRSEDPPITRMDRLLAAADKTPAMIDFELADWESQPDLRSNFTAAARGCAEPRRLILSSHDFAAPPPDADDRVARALRFPQTKAAKLAYACRGANDSFLALDLMRRFGESVIAVAMGDFGLWTRVLARKLQAFASFASLEYSSATADGQVPIADLIELYRWRSLEPRTSVFGLLGDPVAHSMSPLIHNLWLEQAGINGVYLPFRVEPETGALSRFLAGLLDRDWLHPTGFSVTIPHKRTVLKRLGDGADRLALFVGAANTITVAAGRPTGFNTDCYAALESICAALGRRRHELIGLNVDVLGSGGAARALVAGLHESGCKVRVYARSAAGRESLATAFACQPHRWEERSDRQGDILVNATSIGMGTQADQSPMPEGTLSGCRLVFDMIYNPPETVLLRQARTAGVHAVNGMDMFLRQAAAQFHLWTRRQPDPDPARARLVQALNASPSSGDSPR